MQPDKEVLVHAGSTLLIPSGPQGDHLFFCVLEPKVLTRKDCVLLVPLCSVRAKFDSSCIVEVGEHPFVSHKSFIDYRHARVDAVEDIERKLLSKYFKRGDPADQALLTRIQQGLQLSSRVQRHIKDDWV